MKKLILIALMALSLCSCGATNTEKTISSPSLSSSVEIKPNKDIEEVVDAVDGVLKESLGEYIFASGYSEETGKYMALMSFDGINEVYGSEEFDTICDMLDDVSIAIYRDLDLENVLVLCSDDDSSACLYATDSGDDITYIFR